jgi:putative acetyltransferase
LKDALQVKYGSRIFCDIFLSEFSHSLSLDASGGSVFLNLIRPAMLDAIRAAASTLTFGAYDRFCMLVEIREERPGDVAAIRDLNKRAFEQDQEGNIVDALRANGAVLLSLIAILNGRVVGHIMYSPLSLGGEVTGAGLGPMAVLPEYQNQGIGSKLVKVGNQKLKDAGCPFVIVVGHANYYPRFGFKPASAHGIECEWEVPDNAFMLLVLDQTKMQSVSGLAKYRHEFSTVT